MTWLTRLWRGELSLPITFWLYGVFGLFLVSLPSIILDQIYPDLDDAPGITVLIYAISFFSAIIYFIFIFVAIWRSACKYREQLLERLWRGELSLFNTYWFFGGLGAFALYILLLIVDAIYLHPDAMPEIAAVLYISFGLFAIIYFVVISVAIWRSAGNYKGSKGWEILARISVVIGIVSFGLGLFR